MAIIRTKRTSNFTVINNDLINDKMLDWRDLGLLTYLLSKPDNWEVSVAHLQKERKTGRYAIYESLKNLTAAGYVKGRAKQGGFEYLVFDVSTIDLAENHEAENHEAENHEAENHRRENHRRENPPQVNTDSLTNTEINQELTLSKESARKKPKISLPDYIDKATWDEWMTVRKKKGAVISETSTTRLLNTLALVEADYELRSHGITPNEAIAIAIEQSWKGLNIEWLHNRLKQQGGSNATRQQHNQPAKLSAAERVEKAIAEKFGNAGMDIIEGECRRTA